MELPDDLTTPEGSSTRAEALGVLEVIRTLPSAYRETLVLRLVEGAHGSRRSRNARGSRQRRFASICTGEWPLLREKLT